MEDIGEIIIDFGAICRYCLSETTSSTSVFDICSKEPLVESIYDLVYKLTSIEITKDDGFPTLICLECYEKVHNINEFVQMINQSEVALKDSYNKTLEETQASMRIDDRTYQDEIVDMHLSNLEFPIHEVRDHVQTIIPEPVKEHKLKEKKKQILKGNQQSIIDCTTKPNDIIVKETYRSRWRKRNSLSEKLRCAQEKLAEDLVTSKMICKIQKEIKDEFEESQAIGVGLPIIDLKYDIYEDEFKKVEGLKAHDLQKHDITVYESKGDETYTLYYCMHCGIRSGSFTIDGVKLHLSTSHSINNPLELQDFKSLMQKYNLAGTLKDFDVKPNLKQSAKKGTKRRAEEMGMDASENKFKIQKYNLSENVTGMRNEKQSVRRNTKKITIKEEVLILDPTELLQLFVCIDCTPPKSFDVVTSFLKHKITDHDVNLDDISTKEVAPIFVNTTTLFDADANENQRDFQALCKDCEPPLWFQSIYLYLTHMKLTHDRLILPVDSGAVKKFECLECFTRYSRITDLRKHLRVVHNQMIRGSHSLNKCPKDDCGLAFSSQAEAIKHGIQEHNMYFKEHLQHRYNAGKHERNFECEHCLKKFTEKRYVKSHILGVHFKPTDEEVVYEACPYCAKTFKHKISLKYHIENLHEVMPVECPLCKKLVSLRYLKRHYKRHEEGTIQQRFLCNTCGRVLHSERTFNNHLRIHANIRDHICDICGSGFTSPKNLSLHQRIHSGQRRLYECEQCKAQFKGRHTLNRHLLTHTGEKNFVCEICSKPFYTLQEVRRHIKGHRGEYKFDCQYCDRKFYERTRYRTHLMRHKNIRPYKCTFCDKLFIKKAKLNQHMASRHDYRIEDDTKVWKDPKTYYSLEQLLKI